MTSRMNVLSHCLDCADSEIPSYLWSIEELINGVWTQVDLLSKTANGQLNGFCKGVTFLIHFNSSMFLCLDLNNCQKEYLILQGSQVRL